MSPSDTQATFVFAGGGTGGHLFPGIAVALELRRRHPHSRLIFVGSGRQVEQPAVTRHGFEFHTLPAEPLSQLVRRPWRFVWRNWSAVRQAQRFIEQWQPAAVIGLGGYASAPLVWAARRKRLPIVLLEQNAVPGRATRWLSRWANRVCLTYPESVTYFTCRVDTQLLGNPVRPEIIALAHAPRQEPRPPRLLVLGGSLGAAPLNAAVPLAVRELRDQLAGWEIWHQTGATGRDEVAAAYAELGLAHRVAEFFEDMAGCYAGATLALCRAGATTLSELACAQLPAILVPYPQAADQHQLKNARACADQEAARVVLQQPTADATAAALRPVLQELCADASLRDEMSAASLSLAKPHAARDIATLILELTGRSAE